MARARARETDGVAEQASPSEATGTDREWSKNTGGVRWILSPRAVFGLVCLAAVGLLIAFVVSPRDTSYQDVKVMVSGTPVPWNPDAPAAATRAAPDRSRGSAAGRTGGSEGSTEPEGTGQVVVHVIGAVNRPGLVRVPEGALVDDALRAAGGPSAEADLEAMNLAECVSRGQQIRVPTHAETESDRASEPGTARGSGASASAAGPGTTAHGKVNLNRASVEELQTLPKVGPKLAQRIMDWRNQSGPFRSVSDLDAVPGIGPTLLASLEPLVTV